MEKISFWEKISPTRKNLIQFILVQTIVFALLMIFCGVLGVNAHGCYGASAGIGLFYSFFSEAFASSKRKFEAKNILYGFLGVAAAIIETLILTHLNWWIFVD